MLSMVYSMADDNEMILDPSMLENQSSVRDEKPGTLVSLRTRKVVCMSSSMERMRITECRNVEVVLAMVMLDSWFLLQCEGFWVNSGVL